MEKAEESLRLYPAAKNLHVKKGILTPKDFSYIFHIKKRKIVSSEPTNRERMRRLWANEKMFVWGGNYAGAVAKQDLHKPDIPLPAALPTVEAGEFAGIQNVVIWVPGTVNYIAPDAFDLSVTILCPAGSYAEGRCTELCLACLTE